MDTVARIIVSTTKKRDLLLTFAIQDDSVPGKIRCIILLRSPGHEKVFEPHEQGIAVSIEGQDDHTKDIEGNLLREFTFDPQTKTATLKTRNHTCHLDLHQSTPAELTQLQTYLTQMNFDAKAQITGL